jgi:hypothetical protein
MDQKAFGPANPLAKHFRHPSIYLKLPSQGIFWPSNSVSIPVTGEIPVLPMTTKDEIILRTPDALLNGQGVVSAIESCCPSIKNAWDMPSIDVDATIIAIRIASYGNQMDFNATCPHCDEISDYAIDLGLVLESVTVPDYNKTVASDGLKIKLKPQSYAAMNQVNMISFEEQQIMRTLGDMQDDNRIEAQAKFDAHLNNLIDLNISTLASSTDYIETDDGTIVNNLEYINEFYKNCDTKIIKSIQAQLEEFNEVAKLKPVTVNCHHCDQQFNVEIEFDWANFFANGS